MLSEPLIQIILAFITGIIVGNYLPPYISFLYSGIIFTFLISLLFFHFKPHLLPYFILILFFLSGVFHLQNSNLISSSDVSHLIPGKYRLMGTIVQEPKKGKFKTNLILRAEMVLRSGKQRKVTGKVWVSPKCLPGSIKVFHYGDRVEIEGAHLSRPSLPGNPGEFDFKNWLAKQKIYTVVESVTRKDSSGNERDIKIKITDLEKIGNGRVNPLLKYSSFLRRKIENFVEKVVVGEPQTSIIEAMTLGEKQIPNSIKEPFLKTGIFHVLIVSGLHVGFIILFVALFTPFLSLRWKEIITILTIVFYCLLTGARPPVLRASLMAIIYFTGFLLNRKSYPYLAIACAAFIILFFNPNQLFAPGFQLSFIITLGILFFSPYLMEKLPKKFPFFLRGAIAVPIAAQLTAFPLLAFHFHYFSLLAPLTNILLIPLAGFNVGLSFLTILFGSLSLKLGLILGATDYLFTSLLFKLTKLFAQIPFADQEIGHFSLLHLFCYYGFLISIFNLHRLKIMRQRAKLICLSAIFLLVFFFVPGILARINAVNFRLTVLKVPDGNSFFIRFPDKKNFLMIGDEDNYRDVEKIIKPFLWSRAIRRIDYLLLDSVGDDHLAAFSELKRDFRIREIIDYPRSNSSITYKNFLKEVLSLKKIDYRRSQEKQILIKSPLGYRVESLGNGFYRVGYKNRVITIGILLTHESYQNFFSLKRSLKSRILILPSLPPERNVLSALIRKVRPKKIILTQSRREKPGYLPQGIALFYVQKQGAISLKFE